MSPVRTIRQLPSLSRLMKAQGGVYAKTALDKAAAIQVASRDAHLILIDEALGWMTEWREQVAPSAADWEALHEASAGIIGLCDATADAHLLRASRLLCEYVDRCRHGTWSREVAALFINTLKAIAARDADPATRAAVLGGLEALVPKTDPGSLASLPPT